MRVYAKLIFVLLLIPGLAGCIEPPRDGAEPVDAASSSSPSGNGPPMTAEERVEESDGVAAAGLLPRFFAQRVITIEGALDLERLPVDLETPDGDVALTGGAAGEWRLVATLRAEAATPEEAKRLLDTIALEWEHEDGERHLVAAEVRMDALETPVGPVRLGADGRSGSLALVVPRDVLLDGARLRGTDGDVAASGVRATTLDARSTDGDVAVEGVVADAIEAETTDGSVSVQDVKATTLSAESTDGDVSVEGASARDVRVKSTDGAVAVEGVYARHVVAKSTDGGVTLDAVFGEEFEVSSTDGDVTATLIPTGSGRILAESTDGDVRVRVPEDARIGYDASLSTTDGDAEVRLREGETTHDDGPGGSKAAFRSRSLDGREIVVRVALDSVNGDVLLAPA